MRNPPRRPGGLAGFVVIWLGQIVSVLASGMSGFALTLWMYQQTGSATAMGLMQVFYITPFLLLSIPAGVMVDRYNRKLMMMVSDLAAVVATFGILLLLATGQLRFWHLYIANVLYGLGNTFQWPAYSAAISSMVPREQLGRANGLMSLMEAGPAVLAPVLAGALYPLIGLGGLLAIDVATFFLAIGALLVVAIPQPARTAEGERARQGGFLQEAMFGFRYIFNRPSLLGLQMIFLAGNLFAGVGFTVLAPMILARTDQNALAFGTVQTAGAIGGVIGGVLMSAWGGFQKRTHGVLLGWILFGLVGMLFMGVGRGLAVWIPASILGAMVGPVMNASNQAIWQSRVAPDLQGRVFSARRLIAWFTNPISPIIGGTLADFVFEPAMRNATVLQTVAAPLVGTGPGAGMGLLLVLCGLGAAAIGGAGYLIPAVREAEARLADQANAAASVPR